MAQSPGNLSGKPVRHIKPLNDLQIRRLARPGRHSVGAPHGLMLYVQSPAARSWVLRVSVGGKRRDIGLGGYPSVTLDSARTRARALCDSIWAGADPLAERRRIRSTAPAAVVTFEQAARQCHAAKAAGFRSTKHRDDWVSSLARYAFPDIGPVPVAEVDETHVLRVLNPIWTTKTETASRVRGRMETVLSWAKVQKLRAGDNPARWRGNLEHTLAKPTKLKKVTRRRALPWKAVPEFVAELRERNGYGARALEWVVLTLGRSMEARLATHAEIDMDTRLWTLAGPRMKSGLEHRVPLVRQSVQLVQRLRSMSDSPYLFPAPGGGPLSDMALLETVRQIKAPCTPHGFRSSFKEWARETQGAAFADEVSELCLAHVNSDETRAAYARDGLLDLRRQMLNKWAAFCYGARK